MLLVASIRLLQNEMPKFFTLNMGSPGNKGVNWLRIIVKAEHISFFTSGSIRLQVSKKLRDQHYVHTA